MRRADLTMAGRIAFAFLWLFVLSFPAEKAFDIPGLGTVSRLFGLVRHRRGCLRRQGDGGARLAFDRGSAVWIARIRLIRGIGSCTLVPETRRQPFQSLVQAVAHQQLNGTAANTILTRFKKLFPGRNSWFLCP